MSLGVNLIGSGQVSPSEEDDVFGRWLGGVEVLGAITLAWKRRDQRTVIGGGEDEGATATASQETNFAMK